MRLVLYSALYLEHGQAKKVAEFLGTDHQPPTGLWQFVQLAKRVLDSSIERVLRVDGTMPCTIS